MIGVLIFPNKIIWRQKQTHRECRDVRTLTEKTVKHPQAKECQRSQANARSTRGREGALLEGVGRAWPHLYLGFRLLTPRTISDVPSHAGLALWYSSPGQLIHPESTFQRKE